MASTPTLGYWNIRGIAEPIRFLLHYKGVDFVDKRYTFENREEWVNDKFNLGLTFPNLPYYIDGDVKLTQSMSVLRYLAQKHQLDGATPEQKNLVSMVEQQLVDFRWYFFHQIIRDDAESEKQDFLEKAFNDLKILEDFLADKLFLIGDDITYVDFLAYETLDFYRLYVETILDGFPKLKEYHQRIKNLPELQGYLNSSTYRRWPLFGRLAKFGVTGEEPAHA